MLLASADDLEPLRPDGLGKGCQDNAHERRAEDPGCGVIGAASESLLPALSSYWSRLRSLLSTYLALKVTAWVRFGRELSLKGRKEKIPEVNSLT